MKFKQFIPFGNAITLLAISCTKQDTFTLQSSECRNLNQFQQLHHSSVGTTTSESNLRLTFLLNRNSKFQTVANLFIKFTKITFLSQSRFTGFFGVNGNAWKYTYFIKTTLICHIGITEHFHL
jgi:hypothetical protein